MVTQTERPYQGRRYIADRLWQARLALRDGRLIAASIYLGQAQEAATRQDAQVFLRVFHLSQRVLSQLLQAERQMKARAGR